MRPLFDSGAKSERQPEPSGLILSTGEDPNRASEFILREVAIAAAERERARRAEEGEKTIREAAADAKVPAVAPTSTRGVERLLGYLRALHGN